MNEYINLSLENIEEEHICCAIGDPKHQEGVDCKKEWIKNNPSKVKEQHKRNYLKKREMTLRDRDLSLTKAWSILFKQV